MAGVVATGAYLLSGHDGPYAVERFRLVRTGAAWRYDATRVDPRIGAPLGRLEVHVDGGAVRLHVEAGGWVLRGAAAGGEVLWRRADEQRSARGDGFAGSSPAHLLAAASLGRTRLNLVEVTEPVLATRTTTQSWTALGAEEHDGVLVDAWQVDDLATGERRTLRLAGDVVVQAPGVRLLELDYSPA